MVKANKKSQRLVEELEPIISESMGKRSGEVFYKFYEFEDDEEVLGGARSLLYELMGKKMADHRLKKFIKNHET